MKRVNDRLKMIKLLIGKWIVAILSTHASQQGLSEDAKNKLHKDSISFISKVGM